MMHSLNWKNEVWNIENLVHSTATVLEVEGRSDSDEKITL